LLDQACGSLEKLDELGAASLFWGERTDMGRVSTQLREVRGRISAFQAQLGELENRRQAVLSSIGSEEETLEFLGEDLYDIRQQEERRKLEWVVEREISPVSNRVEIMAWARGGDEDKRFRKSLTASVVGSLVFGALLPLIELPLPRRFQPDAMPQRIVQLLREENAKPVPPPSVLADRLREQARTEQLAKAIAEAKPSNRPGPLAPEALVDGAPETAGGDPGGPLSPDTPGFHTEQPQPRAGKAGVLAFRDQFASLAKDRVAPRLGADARFSNADAPSQGLSTRSMLTTNAPGSSGGINLAALSRNLGGGGGGGGVSGNGSGGGGGLGGGGGTGGGGIAGVPVGRATSSIASIGGGDERPRARAGLGPSRTDEEIQIVFDRYKASFYRLYNRELRSNPTLKGQMVLRLTIEPDGSVSMCVLQSSDMDAPELATQVVSRVRTINFGAKEGVQAMTIVYPIDFLPAS
jgi:uncharacterized membrane protein YgcG